jgi:hypothetical protein
VADARAAIVRAHEALAASSSTMAASEVAIAEARVRVAENPREVEAAVAPMRALLARTTPGAAEGRWLLRLALAELHAQGADDLLQLAREARAQGFVLVALEAESAAGK